MVADCFLNAACGSATRGWGRSDYLTGLFVFKTTCVLAFRRASVKLAAETLLDSDFLTKQHWIDQRTLRVLGPG